ncbi:PKD domain-containing protein, partial [Candidatus Woesearchaeota archaeon]|nr:PKD domain-containing protein [Candidatus Woesearchaeota archaeon]
IVDSMTATSMTAGGAGPVANTFLVEGLSDRQYMWTVRCTDSAGQFADGAARIFAVDTAGGPAAVSFPDVDLFVSDTAGEAPLTVDFAVDVTGDSPFTFDWDFGDGTAHSGEEDVSHVFTAPGTYVVTLIVTNADGDATTVQVHITVDEPFLVIDPHRDLRISMIRLLGSPGFDEAAIGDDVLLAITLDNEAPVDFDGLHISLSIDDLGVRRVLGPFDLQQNEKVTKFVSVDIPADALPGEVSVRVTVSNDDVHRVKYRSVYGTLLSASCLRNHQRLAKKRSRT